MKSDGWVGEWMDGWVDGWISGRRGRGSCFTEQQYLL